MSVKILRTVTDLRAQVQTWKQEGLRVGLVPTMGALHEGHLTLARKAQDQCDRVIATIFVNPKQFGPNEDFDSYPRTENTDAAKLSALGVDVLFAPNAAEMYGIEGGQTTVSVTGLGQILEGEYRPGFFDGVATVVTKLLLQALPDQAFFGEKDYQQLAVIKKMVADLNIPVDIQGVPTVREADGLALSSRNAYLTDAERQIAPQLYATLQKVKERLLKGEAASDLCAVACEELLNFGFVSVDYIAIRKATDLTQVAKMGDTPRILAAAQLGKARLIDNIG